MKSSGHCSANENNIAGKKIPSEYWASPSLETENDSLIERQKESATNSGEVTSAVHDFAKENDITGKKMPNEYWASYSRETEKDWLMERQKESEGVAEQEWLRTIMYVIAVGVDYQLGIYAVISVICILINWKRRNQEYHLTTSEGVAWKCWFQSIVFLIAVFADFQLRIPAIISVTRILISLKRLKQEYHQPDSEGSWNNLQRTKRMLSESVAVKDWLQSIIFLIAVVGDFLFGIQAVISVTCILINWKQRKHGYHLDNCEGVAVNDWFQSILFLIAVVVDFLLGIYAIIHVTCILINWKRRNQGYHLATSAGLLDQHRSTLLCSKRNDIFVNPGRMMYQMTQGWNLVEQCELKEEIINNSYKDEFTQLFTNNDGNMPRTTIVCGVAGCGKSKMIQKIIHDWATKYTDKQFTSIFKFKCHALNSIRNRTNLNNLILDAHPYLKNCLDNLWREPKKMLFIFDNYDTLNRAINSPIDERNSVPFHQCIEPQSYCYVSDIVHSLIQGNLLNGCSILITTRPWKLEDLRQTRLDATFQLAGFTTDNTKEYFHHYFQDAVYAEQIMQMTGQSEILRCMSCNPLLCSILSSYLKSQKSQGAGQIRAINCTRVLSAYLLDLLQRCGYDRETSRKCLQQLGEMAYQGIACRKYSFETSALSDLNYYLPNFTSAFITQVPEKDKCDFKWKFSYSIIQDFLAALTKIQITPGSQLKEILDACIMVNDDRFKTFSRFIFGFSSRNLADCFQWKLGSFPSDVSTRVTEWIRKSMKNRMSNIDRKGSQVLFLNMLHCLFEFDDKELNREIMEGLQSIRFDQCVLKSLDCAVLSSVIDCSEEIKELHLNSCGVKMEEIQQLQSVLHKCKRLRLGVNDLGDSGVKLVSTALREQDCKIESLEVNSVGLTQYGAENLVAALSTNRSLMELDLGDNQLGDSGVKLVAEALVNPYCNIRKLCLKEVGVTDCGVEDFVSVLSTNRSVTELDLGSNLLADGSVPALRLLIQSLPTLQRIWLRGNHFSGSGEKQLKSLQDFRPELSVDV
ncbi:NACHT, LRR and PYD domains-containing protein 3-like [Narcine bancroftii]|uniref:NACHT, LRR and PYD domains-containing protein 3-like n=1 Tax=Narcine bancroftii TaxID=1343680 RepID=UPI003831D3C3